MSVRGGIVLKKSFWGDDHNFSGPLMPFARDDLRDHIVSHKNDHGASHGFYAVLQWWIRPKISFCEISVSFNFTTAPLIRKKVFVGQSLPYDTSLPTIDREHGCQHPSAGNGRRRLDRSAGAGGICTDATIRRRAATTIRTENAETATPTQDCKETRAAVDGPGGTATAIWFVWQRHLVSRLTGAPVARLRSSLGRSLVRHGPIVISGATRGF